jgi:hypothetical protein
MFHHFSFNAAEPGRVARVLARILGGAVLRAPAPPFPAGAWFLCSGDARGSYLEILPPGYVFDPAVKGMRFEAAAGRASGAHVLLGSPLSAPEIEREAAAAGWRTEVADARPLFRVLKLWVENEVLIELLPPEWAADYLATFGPAGIAALDGKFRALEAEAARQAS